MNYERLRCRESNLRRDLSLSADTPGRVCRIRFAKCGCRCSKEHCLGLFLLDANPAEAETETETGTGIHMSNFSLLCVVWSTVVTSTSKPCKHVCSLQETTVGSRWAPRSLVTSSYGYKFVCVTQWHPTDPKL